MHQENSTTPAPFRPSGEPPAPRVAHPPCRHEVQFYRTDAFLIDSVTAFLETGFRNGDAVFLVVTPGHRESVEKTLARSGRRTPDLVSGGRLVILDAEQTLERLLVDGWPDEARFREAMGGAIARSLRAGRGVRAFGEMVALLWARGLDAAAIRLEELWNELGRDLEFTLFCAYPMAAFQDSEKHAVPFARICRAHDRVVPPEETMRAPASRDGAPPLPPRPEAPAGPAADRSRRTRGRQDSQQLAAIVDSSFDGIISKDLDGTITSWNQAATRIFGYTAAEAVGRPVSMLIPPHLMGEETRILARLRGGERVEPFETVRVHKDGHALDVSLTVSPVRDGSGAIVGASKIVRDITEQKRNLAALAEKEEQLRQAQKMEAVGRLAGGIAHDFNNLLTAINGYSEMALALVREGETMHEFLQEIRMSGERAAALTRQLLAYSRKQILAPAVFDLNATVAEMLRMLRRLIGEDIEIETVLDPGLGKVKADPGQVQQIILNLALNARDAMPHGGRLVIETSNRIPEATQDGPRLDPPPGPQVMLSVSDTGVGMEEAVKARIFEPFFTTKEVGAGPSGRTGTGLGLSSVYGILKQSGGGIQVESEPGRGSVFRILLPRAADGAPETGRARAAARPPDGRKGTILLVEDEETVRNFVARSLSSLGYTLIEAKDGTSALELGREQASLDLLLTDMVMPGMDGVRLAESLRAAHPGLKAVFMSGYPDKVTLPRGFPERQARFIHKPFGQAQVARLVQEFLEPAGTPALPDPR